MKVLRVVLFVLLALVAILVIKGLATDPAYDVSRTIEIDAPSSSVWPYVVSLKAADEWNAWMEIDPNTKKEYGGEEGAVGSWASWDSEHQDVGHGKQTIMKLDEGKLVESKLELAWGSPSTGYIELDEREGKTTVKYGFKGKEEQLMARIMTSFFDMDKVVGAMFDKGLTNLKTMVEAEETGTGQVEDKVYRGYSISRINKDQLVCIGKRKVVGFEEIKDFYTHVFPSAGAAVSAMKYNMDGMPCGVYFDWNEEEKTADLFAAMPIVAEADVNVKGFETLVIPGGKALVIDYYGPYEESAEAHYAMDDMMKEQGIAEPTHVIEQYMNDPTGLDPSEWHTRIYYMIS